MTKRGVFTDENLADWKRWLGNLPNVSRTIESTLVSVEVLAAMIARIDAAEKALDHNVPTDPDYMAWRAACGKTEKK